MLTDRVLEYLRARGSSEEVRDFLETLNERVASLVARAGTVPHPIAEVPEGEVHE